MKISSYPKVWNLGHPSIRDLLRSRVIVEEKIDGSQINWGLIDGGLCARSKGAELSFKTTDQLFRAALDSIQVMADKGLLVDGWVYRGEALRGRKHNTLNYGRVPDGNLVLFDVYTNIYEAISDYDKKAAVARHLGISAAPRMFEGVVSGTEQLLGLLEMESFLGGPQIEGVVLKRYDLFGPDGKYLFGKYVSEKFKETHREAWKTSNPAQGDILLDLGVRLATEARWEKAVQHLTERGEITNTPKDIGPLMAEVARDIEQEEKEWIQEKLWKWAWEKIRKRTASGLPEWYKRRLMANQFETTST